MLLNEIRQCRECEQYLPFGPRPILQADSAARILIIGQAPGRRVHESGIPWDDASGDRLRSWMGIERAQFYDAGLVALVPMGFCYRRDYYIRCSSEAGRTRFGSNSVGESRQFAYTPFNVE